MRDTIVLRSTKEDKLRRTLQQKVAKRYLKIVEADLPQPILCKNRLTGEVSYYR